MKLTAISTGGSEAKCPLKALNFVYQGGGNKREEKKQNEGKGRKRREKKGTRKRGSKRKERERKGKRERELRKNKNG